MREAWLTPNDAPTGQKILKLYVPEGEEWEAIVRGALAPLLLPENFEEYGAYTPEETAEVFLEYLTDTFTWEVC